MLQKWRSSGEPCRILDAGCGNGYLAGVLLDEGFEVIGVDASAQGIAIARASHPKGHFECASLYDELGPTIGECDAVVSTEVIEHLYDPRRFINGLRRLTRPGGLVILSTPYHGYVKNLALAILGRFDRHFTSLWDGGHIKFWSRRTLKRLLAENGFEVVDFGGCGRLPYLWKSMVMVARKSRVGGES